MKVLLKYGFIFDPAEAWADQNQLETDMGKFFASKGLTAELIECAPGQENIPLIYLKKSDSVKVDTQPVSFNPKEINALPARK